MKKRIYSSFEVKATYVTGIEVTEEHSAQQLDSRSQRTTLSMLAAVSNLLYCNNVELYVELGAASAHNVSYIKKLIEIAGGKIVTVKYRGSADIVVDIDGKRYTIRLIPHTFFKRNKFLGSNCDVILDHGLRFIYGEINE